MKVASRKLDNAGANEGGSSGSSYVMIRRNYKVPARDITSDAQGAKRQKTDTSHRHPECFSQPVANVPISNEFSLLDGTTDMESQELPTNSGNSSQSQ